MIKKVDFSFLEAIDEVIDAFKDWGFNLVTKLEVWEKIQNNIDNNFNNLYILWFCKMNYAYEYLKEDLNYWVFMPCMVSVYEKEGEVYVSAWIPKWIFAWVELSSKLEELSQKIDIEIKDIINKI